MFSIKGASLDKKLLIYISLASVSASPQTFFIGPAKDFQIRVNVIFLFIFVASLILDIIFLQIHIVKLFAFHFIGTVETTFRAPQAATFSNLKSLAGPMKKVCGDALKLASEM